MQQIFGAGALKHTYNAPKTYFKSIVIIMKPASQAGSQCDECVYGTCKNNKLSAVVCWTIYVQNWIGIRVCVHWIANLNLVCGKNKWHKVEQTEHSPRALLCIGIGASSNGIWKSICRKLVDGRAAQQQQQIFLCVASYGEEWVSVCWWKIKMICSESNR